MLVQWCGQGDESAPDEPSNKHAKGATTTYLLSCEGAFRTEASSEGDDTAALRQQLPMPLAAMLNTETSDTVITYACDGAWLVSVSTDAASSIGVQGSEQRGHQSGIPQATLDAYRRTAEHSASMPSTMAVQLCGGTFYQRCSA